MEQWGVTSRSRDLVDRICSHVLVDRAIQPLSLEPATCSGALATFPSGDESGLRTLTRFAELKLCPTIPAFSASSSHFPTCSVSDLPALCYIFVPYTVFLRNLSP